MSDGFRWPSEEERAEPRVWQGTPGDEQELDSAGSGAPRGAQERQPLAPEPGAGGEAPVVGAPQRPSDSVPEERAAKRSVEPEPEPQWPSFAREMLNEARAGARAQEDAMWARFRELTKGRRERRRREP